MTYIKHNGNFYKEVEIEKLPKEELIKIIKEAIEINPQIIERWNTIREYVDRYPWWEKSITRLWTAWDTITMAWNVDNITTNFANMDNNDLITLCNTI